MLEFYILGNRNSEQSLFHLKLSLTAGFESIQMFEMYNFQWQFYISVFKMTCSMN